MIGAPPGPFGKAGGQRRRATATAHWHSASKWNLVTNISALTCRSGPRRATPRWYAGGGTGAVATHGTGTMANLPTEGNSLGGETAYIISSELGNALYSLKPAAFGSGRPLNPQSP